jgi:hypothetical protein
VERVAPKGIIHAPKVETMVVDERPVEVRREHHVQPIIHEREHRIQPTIEELKVLDGGYLAKKAWRAPNSLRS